MTTLLRTSFATTALTVALVLTLFVVTTAQVASLRTPDPEADPLPAAAGEELDGQEAILAFAACMRDNGVDMDDPQFGSGGGLFRLGGPPGDGGPGLDVQSDDFQAAFETCGSLLAALRPELDPEQQAELAERQVALAECMRARDYDFPDPDPNGAFGFGAGRRAALDAAGPDFQTDFAACQEEIGGFGFGPGGGPAGNAGVSN